MNKIISEKQMMKCVEEVKTSLISSQGEGDMPLQEFILWVMTILKDCYNYDEDGYGE